MEKNPCYRSHFQSYCELPVESVTIQFVQNKSFYYHRITEWPELKGTLQIIYIQPLPWAGMSYVNVVIIISMILWEMTLKLPLLQMSSLQKSNCRCLEDKFKKYNQKVYSVILYNFLPIMFAAFEYVLPAAVSVYGSLWLNTP